MAVLSLSLLVREPDDLGVVAGWPRDLARLPELFLDLAEPRLRPSRDRHLPGAHDLVDAEGAQQVDDGLDLRGLTGDLEGVGARSDVDQLGAEDVGDAEDLRAIDRKSVVEGKSEDSGGGRVRTGSDRSA